MMDSATPPCGFAQNDGIARDIQVSYRNEGSLQSFTCEAVSTHLTLTVCEEHDDRAEKYVIESFPLSFVQGSVPPSKVQRGRVGIPGDFSELEVHIVEDAG